MRLRAVITNGHPMAQAPPGRPLQLEGEPYGIILCMRHPLLTVLARLAERVLGRARLAKLARLVTNEVRLDVANDLRTNGEAAVQRVALKEASPVVLDVGAHFGEWSSSLLSMSTGTLVLHVFEPSTHSATRARQALGGRGEVHQVAMSNEPGSGLLLVVHEGAGSNSVVPFVDEGKGPATASEEISLDTVDNFCSEHQLRRVTLLKTDAEGHDLAVLRGASEMLGSQCIDLIQFEYNHRWIDARVFLLDAFLLLQSYGYRVGKVTPRGVETYARWHPELEKFVEGNYLAYLPEREVDLEVVPWWGG